MSDFDFEDSGFEEFSKLMTEFSAKASDVNVLDVLRVGAEEFINDLERLPRPKSQISKPGYTHLVDSFGYRTNGKEIEAGWGKYYGPMVENGTTNMSARPHLKPLWQQNEKKYYAAMQKKLFD